MERKEQWIENTLNSIENMRRAETSSGLYEQLIANASQGVRLTPISNKTMWRVAAAIGLLIALNVFSLAKFNSTNDKHKQGNAFSQEYFSYVNEVQL